MRARDLVEDFPTIDAGTDALFAARLMIERGLPGLVVVDEHGYPSAVLPGSQVLRFALPDYVEEDPSLAAVFPEAEADELGARLRGHTVGELMPSKIYLPQRDQDRPIVVPDATAIQIASVMSSHRTPIVAVVEAGRTFGVITVHRLLAALIEGR